MSRINRPPISLSAVSKYMTKIADEKRIAVVVGTVVDDKRLFKVPKLTVCFFCNLTVGVVLITSFVHRFVHCV